MKALNEIRFPRMFGLNRSQEERQFDASNQFRLNQNFRSITDSIVAVEESIEKLPANILAAIANPIDYVVAAGQDGRWTYRKWNSGVAECWCESLELQKSVTTASGSLYISSHTLDLPLGLFTTISCAILTPVAASAITFVSLRTVSSSSVTATISATASALVTLKLYAHITGRWKG